MPETFTEEQIHESLDLLNIQDFSNLKNSNPSTVRGTISWARLANGAGNGLLKLLRHVSTDDGAVRVAELCGDLGERLRARDGSKQGRVTLETRELINLVTKAGKILDELVGIKNGDLPTWETGGRATTLKVLWGKVVGPFDTVQNKYVSSLLQEVASKVLVSSATDGIKSLYTRALQQWLNEPQKRQKVVNWDSDDDDF